MENICQFLKDVGRKPSQHYSIDRIDSNGNYEPGNVRWATQKEQCRNKIKNRLLTFDGQTFCMSEWAEKLGLSVQTIAWRLNYKKMTPHDALSIPVMKTSRSFQP